MSQPEPLPKPKYSAGATAALLVIGLLFLVPSGLCTGIFGGGALVEMFFYPQNAGDAASMILMATVFGGPFIAAGGAMVWYAIKRIRANRSGPTT